MKVPNPLSWQALLGLWSWDCAGGVCVPGLNGLSVKPGWLNNITSVFGYDQDIPRQSCFVDVFLMTAGNDLNPFAPNGFDALQGVFQAWGAARFNQALIYAASKGLTYPNKSSVFRAILKGSGKAMKAGDALALASVNIALIDGLIAEINSMDRGECQ
jgi:hypothetical protein